MRKTLSVLFLIGLLAVPCARGQQPAVNPALLRTFWSAQWITPPGVSLQTYGVYHFRKTIELSAKPASFVVHVSADNRYRLFVNGRAVGSGPARSDLLNWNFETIDLAPYLQAGRNVLAAVVWNAAESRPFAQITYQTGFLMQGNTAAEETANTDTTWKALHNRAYRPLPLDRKRMGTFVATGDGDEVDGNTYPWGWEKPGHADAAWPAARPMWFPAKPRGVGTDGNWMLAPRQIPPMEERSERLRTVRRVVGVRADNAFAAGKQTLVVPAHSRATVLLDQGHLTNAYPELVVSDGRNASVTLTYAEALVDTSGQKGNRNEIEGRQIIGVQDRFIADGGERRVFRPLWFRTYRYLQLDIETHENPLAVNDLYGMFTAYPFQENGYFKTPDPVLARIWETGWRTARLCAQETYVDCPYYEQLQYVGDTRVQAMISLYVSGDDRLMRKAILDYDHSRIPEGLTQSRYPSYDLQVIPTFSLFWTAMIHDYWMHRRDDAFVQARLKGVADVLEWHRQRMDPGGLMGRVEWWNFVDWSWPWVTATRIGGVPAGVDTGGSAILSLQYAYALQRAAEVFGHFGRTAEADGYRRTAARLTATVQATCWDAGRSLFADTPAKTEYSQHANILAVLTDALPADRQAALLRKTMDGAGLRQCTYYFRYYLAEALQKAGLGDMYLTQLEPWKTQLALGLSTFAENPEPTRSDCHAWSASPLYHFLSVVCGIRPDAPGFAKVKIEPALGLLPEVEGQVPHPAGNIRVRFQRTRSGGLKGEVTLPPGISGRLVWKGKETALTAGVQKVAL